MVVVVVVVGQEVTCHAQVVTVYSCRVGVYGAGHNRKRVWLHSKHQERSLAGRTDLVEKELLVHVGAIWGTVQELKIAANVPQANPVFGCMNCGW